jgi:hypothetical protein
MTPVQRKRRDSGSIFRLQFFLSKLSPEDIRGSAAPPTSNHKENNLIRYKSEIGSHAPRHPLVPWTAVSRRSYATIVVRGINTLMEIISKFVVSG